MANRKSIERASDMTTASLLDYYGRMLDEERRLNTALHESLQELVSAASLVKIRLDCPPRDLDRLMTAISKARSLEVKQPRFGNKNVAEYLQSGG